MELFLEVGSLVVFIGAAAAVFAMFFFKDEESLKNQR